MAVFYVFLRISRVTKAEPLPRDLLRDKGWEVIDSRVPTADPWTYRSYIQKSKGEFSGAKHGYAVSWSGWFSERSAVYLASGRPVLVQETGYSRWLPTGEGALSFCDLEGALAGLDEINSRYEFHQRAAREIARDYFDARKVLSDPLARVERPTERGSANNAVQ